ncbi:MAG: hypothetical protein ACTHKL_03995 [Streptosporangiaceae bacterium]
MGQATRRNGPAVIGRLPDGPGVYRFQQEIAALDWITSPQRASTMDDTDCTASGWSDGMLVQFKMRGGRVCAWSQRACGQPVAAAALACTPDEWSGFMKRNADLAASLTELRKRPVAASPVLRSVSAR